MNTESKIDQILETRRPLAAKAEEVLHEITGLEGALIEFRQFLGKVGHRLGSDLPEVSERLNHLRNLESDLSSKCDSEKDRIRQIVNRFSRPTLNLGVVGRAGMGKGTLLKSLTGLKDAIIPTGEGSHCTGAPSIILNSPEFKVTIKCHSPESFLRHVITPFCDRLELPVPSSLSQFRNLQIPDLIPECEDGEAAIQDTGGGDAVTMNAILNRLRDYHSNIDRYEFLLGSACFTLTDPEEVREHVAQDDCDGNRIYFKWMAVEIAEIYAPFPMQEIGKIALADTPGIGDFISGAEERLVQTVGSNLDLVIFVNRPPAVCRGVGREDTRLHGLVKKAIPELPLEEWSFFIVNQSADNAKGIETFLEDLKKKQIHTREVFQVNCLSPVEARKTLEKILDYLTHAISGLDQSYLKQTQARLESLKTEAQHFAETARLGLPTSVPTEDYPLFQQKFNQTWKRVNAELSRFVREAAESRDEDDEYFSEALDSLIKHLEQTKMVPNAQDFAQKVDETTGKQSAHAEIMDEVRNTLSQQFLSLDESLEQGFDEMRDTVRAILVDENGGRLGKIIQGDGKEWWNQFRDLWKTSDEKAGVHHLVKVLSEFQLSYRGFIQHRVRKHLDHLDPDRDKSPDLKYSSSDTPEELAEKVLLCYETAVEEIRMELDKIKAEPSEARFAILDEFVDGILRPKEAIEAWERFYQARRGDVWPEEFDELRDRSELVQKWQSQVSVIEEFVEPNSFILI